MMLYHHIPDGTSSAVSYLTLDQSPVFAIERKALPGA